MRRILVLLLLLGVVGALSLPAARASDKSVSIVGVNQGYSPASVTVNPGDTITWTDRDPTPAPHNAICDESCPEAFSSGDPGATGTTGKYQFRYSGTYNYNCAVHPNMKGTVVVTGNVHPPAGAPAAASGPPSTASAASSSGQSSSASASGSSSAAANSGASASAVANSPSTPAAGSGSASDAAGKTPLPPVGQLALPQPVVHVHQASSSGTPWWVLVPAALLLVIAAGVCALAWLGPRPLRGATST